MSESDKNQALTVVIEKLTEIVDNINQRGQHDDSSSNSGGDSPPTEPVVLEIMPEEAETSTTGESNESTSHDPDDAGALTIKNEETASLEVRKAEEPAMVNVVKKGVTGEITVSKEERKPSANSTAPKELFKCVKCDYCSHNKHYLKQHVLLVHTTERPFKCPLCDYSGKRSHSLKEHLVVHSPYRPFTCPFCRASFRKKGHLTNHLKIHASDQGLPCPICKCTLSNPHEMSKHMRQEHLHEVYLCDECDCATTNEADMVAHKHSHGNPTVYCCTTCKYITVQDTSIRKHISTAHKGQGAFTVNSANTARASQPLILLKCSECGFVTRDKITLRNHMLEHHANQTAEASSRGKPSETAESTSTSSSSSSSPTSQAKSTTAEAQRSQHHSEDSSSSPEAKSLEISQSDYTRQSVSGVFCCMICGYTCDHQRSIKAHIWKHSGRKDINYPIFQTVKEPGPSQGSTTGERPKVLGDGGIDPSSEEVDSSCHDNQHQSISENLPAKSAIKTDKTEEGITREKMEDQGVIAEQSKVVTEALHEIKPLQLHTKQERTSEDEDADLRTGVKRKAATYSELDMSIPKLRIIEPMRDSNMNSDDQMNDSQMKLDTRKDFRVCEEAPVKLEQSVVTDQMTSDSPQRSPEVEDNVEEQVVIMESQVGEEYILEHVEIEVETSDDHKSASPYVEKENDENLPEHPTPVSLRALLQRQRSSGDLEKLTKVPVQRTRSGSLDAKTTEDTPQEQGISSSLLAVIEQFRKDAGPTLSADDEMFSEQYVKKFQDHYRCRICQYTSLYITSMKTHLRTHAQHAQRRPKHCNMCSFVAETDNQLDQHKLSHEQQEPITSREYAKTVPNIIRRQAQMKIQSTADVDLSEEEVITTSESPMKQYVCENCDCCFSSIEALLKHKMKKLCWNKHGASTGSDNGSSEEKDCFKCNFCDYIGMSVRSLKSHMKRHWNDLKANQLQESSHLQGSGDSSHAEKFYVCERCTSVFSNIMDLLSHKQNTCAGVVPKCMHCSFTSTDSEAFKKHMTQHVGKLYKCEQCDFVSKSYSKMDTHLKQHIEPSDLHCTLCDFIATSVRSLKSHMKRHVNDQRFVRQPLEQYKCKMCGYICHHLPALKSHMWRHASDSSYSYERTNAVINAALEVGVGNEANATNKASDTPPEYANEEVVMPNSADYSRKVVDGLVAFRCCHCFFETCSKTELNEHMKKHIDIIKKTMEVNNDLFLKKDKVNNT